MAEFKLGRIRFIWKGAWVTGTPYTKDDIIRYGGKTYVCVAGHTAAADFYDDLGNIPTQWNQVSDGSEWKSNWATNQYYKLNDIVKYGGRLYLCNEAHTSNVSASSGTSPETTAGLEADQSKWDLYATSLDWKGDWTTGTKYKVDDVVRYGGISYICNTGHTSSATNNTDSDGLEQDQSKWDVYITGFNWKGSWATTTRYKKNDVVLYGGVSYVCNTGHESATTATAGLESDQGLWDLLHKGITYLGDWSGSSVRYKVNDVVKYGADLWICTSHHTSATLFSDATNWSIWIAGLQFYNSWDSATVYQPGDLVTYGGYAYVALTNHTNKTPTSNLSDWTVFTTGFSFQNDWTSGVDYRVGQVVRLNGFTYACLADHTASSGNVAPNNTYWSRLNSGIKWAATVGVYNAASGTNVLGSGTSATFNVTRTKTYYTVVVNNGGTSYSNNDIIKILGSDLGGISPANDLYLTVTNASTGVIQAGGVTPAGFSATWTTGTAYYLGDAVTMGVNSYICINQHTSGSGNRPDADVTGTYWNLLAAGSINSTLTTQGDTIYYGGAGPTRLPIGTDGQVLRVTGNAPSWAYFGVVNNVVYVAPSGTDTIGNGQGLTLDKPFKTIRYAAKQVEEGYLNTNATQLIVENKQFMMKEVNNFIQYTYKVTTTGTSSNAFTTTNTSGIYTNMPIVFTNTNGGVTVGTTYYVKAIVTNTSFTISASHTNGVANAQFNVSGAGANAGSYSYVSSKAERDTGIVIDAIAYDLSHGGTGNTTAAALAYLNSSGTGYVTGVYSFDITAFIGALSYLSTLVGHAVAKTTPASNYQTLNGVLLANQAIQNTDVTLTSESNVTATLQALIQIVTTGLQNGSTSYVPAAIYSNTTISAKTGTYAEVLPIVIPKYTAVVGDELRGTVVQPALANANLVNDKPKTIAVLNRFKAIIPNLLTNTAVTPTSGNTQTQKYLIGAAGDSGSTAAAAAIVTSTGVIKSILNNGLTNLPTFTFTNPTGYNVGFLQSYGDGKAQIVQNYQFIKDEISAYLALVANGFSTIWSGLGAGGQANCQRDVGYLLDALQYDMTYGGNTQTLIAGSAYFSNNILTISSTEKAATLAAYTRLQTIIGQIVQKQAVTVTSGNTTTQVTTGSVGAGIAGAATFAQARIGEIITWITNGSSPATIAPTAAIALATTALQNGYTALQAAKTEIQADTVGWVQKYYQAVNFNSTTCSRDAGLIVDALSYDMIFGTNFNSIKAGMSYYRATTSAQVVINTQLAAEIGSVNFIGQKAKRIAAYGSVAQASLNIDDIIASITGTISTTATGTASGGSVTVSSSAGMYANMPIVFGASINNIVANRTYWIVSVTDSTTIVLTDTDGGSTPITLTSASGSVVVTAGGQYETCGTNVYNNVLSTINGAEILRANKTFLMNEATAYIKYTYGGTATTTTASNNRITFSAPHNFVAGDLVVFTGTTFGGIIAGDTYYVLTTPTTSTITVSGTQGSNSTVNLSDGSGTMTGAYGFSEALCQRDMAAYVDALVYDIAYLGNYKSMRAATLYKNAITGSLISDMFYTRNGTGVRNMTLSGLTGTLGAANAYGTRRPTAGAYTSLDPGYGPTDSNAWILQRSPYIQNVTTFGTGCVGCKIDGALHTGGNRSIVSNDFTQILSDGIGVWCTGHNSLTELVSVFSYYNYAGYLAELGGKIRATNGNNSYGTYGSLAEGVDTYEVPITATVNNRYNQAQITNVVTDSTNQIYRVEFSNAGSMYNAATYSISGTGYNAATVGDEFRDNAVFQTRIISGGANYVTQSNTAQAGTATSITIAATDSAISAAYLGMRIQLTGGTGNGQTGYFLTYNSGTKLGIIGKESFTPMTVTATTGGTPSTVTVANTQGLYATMPFMLGSTVGGLNANTVYYVQSVVNSTTFTVSGTSGGAAYTTQITTTTGQSVTMYGVGWDHVVPGWPIVSALDLTTAYIIEPRITFTSPTFTITSRTQQNAAWVDCAYGDINATYSAVASTGGTGTSASFTVVRTGVAYAITIAAGGGGYVAGDTLTIPGTSLGGATPTNDATITVTNVSSGSVNNITYSGSGAGGLYIAVPSSGTSTQYSTNGTSWTAGGAIASASWTSIASGAGYWVAVASGGTTSAYTTNGTAWSAGGALPTSGTWSAVCYGNSVFMAVMSGGTAAAYSTNGTTWTATGALPASTTWTGVAYGNGVYVAVASGGTQAAISTNGTTWSSATLPASATWTSVTFGNGRFVAVASGSTNVAYSLNGTTWYSAPSGNVASQTWSKVRYGQGLFIAVSTGSTAIASSSEDGILWTSRTLSTTGSWTSIAFGNPSRVPTWVALTTGTTTANSIVGGPKARGRVKVSANAFTEIRMVEPGSGYSSAPTATVVDPNQTVAATWSVRTGVGALANPTFTNRGAQYSTASATVTGNGYGDEYQVGYYFNVSGLPSQPTPGANVVLTGNSTYYKLVTVTNYLGTGGGLAPYTARFQISPSFTVANAPAHGTAVTMRINYSQVRLTGHDFLSIGTGGVSTTNYPGIPTQAADSTKQTVNNGGGRVFYTATDQDGNFTVGTLFSVQQATGVASINADAFNLAGLNSLTLGSVSLGATSATITQFSTDPYFTANSDNIVPTQKAIKSYVASQIGGGSSALNVNTLTAGVIYISGNSISTTSGVQILVPATMNFTGGINGIPLAMDLLLLG